MGTRSQDHGNGNKTLGSGECEQEVRLHEWEQETGSWEQEVRLHEWEHEA